MIWFHGKAWPSFCVPQKKENQVVWNDKDCSKSWLNCFFKHIMSTWFKFYRNSTLQLYGISHILSFLKNNFRVSKNLYTQSSINSNETYVVYYWLWSQVNLCHYHGQTPEQQHHTGPPLFWETSCINSMTELQSGQ